MCSEDNGIGVAVYQILVCVTLWHMSIRAGVVATIPFQQVDAAPHVEASAQGNHEGLQDFDCTIEKFHGDLLLTIKSLRPVGYTPEISFFISCQPQRELIYWCILGPGVNKTPSQMNRSSKSRQ